MPRYAVYALAASAALSPVVAGCSSAANTTPRPTGIETPGRNFNLDNLNLNDWVTPSSGNGEQCAVTIRDRLKSTTVNNKVGYEVLSLYASESPVSAFDTQCKPGTTFTANQLPKNFIPQLTEAQGEWNAILYDAAPAAINQLPTASISVRANQWVDEIGVRDSTTISLYDGEDGRDFGPGECSVGSIDSPIGYTVLEPLGSMNYGNQNYEIDFVTAPSAAGAGCQLGDLVLVEQ